MSSVPGDHDLQPEGVWVLKDGLDEPSLSGRQGVKKSKVALFFVGLLIMPWLIFGFITRGDVWGDPMVVWIGLTFNAICVIGGLFFLGKWGKVGAGCIVAGWLGLVVYGIYPIWLVVFILILYIMMATLRPGMNRGRDRWDSGGGLGE